MKSVSIHFLNSAREMDYGNSNHENDGAVYDAA